MCSLAKLNGWHVPDRSGCNVHTVTKTSGWPNEDYQMIGNEKMVLSNPIPRDFVPQNADGIQVHGVKWMTILRHPFSRSLSHYYHAHHYKNYTMQQFFSTPFTGGVLDFSQYIPDQQTRWLCGSECHPTRPLGQRALRNAMANLDHFDVVLILEDLKEADSCSRRQMRSLLNWTQMHDPLETTTNERGTRTSGTDWDGQVRANLDMLGRNNNSQVWGMTGPEAMAALGLHNALDMQLYGYARHRCEAIAAQLDGETLTTLHRNKTGNASISYQSVMNEIPSFTTEMLEECYHASSFGRTELQFEYISLVCLMCAFLLSSLSRRLKSRCQ